MPSIISRDAVILMVMGSPANRPTTSSGGGVEQFTTPMKTPADVVIAKALSAQVIDSRTWPESMEGVAVM